jgi:hypothetical protein
MGQFLMNPPSVEGWHEGEEWIDSGSLIERINYASTEISNISSSGVKRIIEIIKETNITDSNDLINNTLETLGYIDITDKTKEMIKEHLRKNKFTNKEDKILDVLKLIVSTPDFQYC